MDNVAFSVLTGWSFESVRFPHRIAMTPAKNNCLGYRGATNLLQTCDQFQRNSKKLNHLTCWNQESHQCPSKAGEISNFFFGWSPTLFKNQCGVTKKRDLFQTFTASWWSKSHQLGAVWIPPRLGRTSSSLFLFTFFFWSLRCLEREFLSVFQKIKT